MKVPGEEEVSGILFMNICGLVQFTVPERLAAVSEVSFTANDKDIAGNLTVSKSDVQTVVLVSDASRTITMKGSFEAGSTFYFVVAPGQINGFSIKVVAENGAEFSKVSTKSITVAAGAVNNLGVIDFTAAPTAVASHSYPNGILSGTDVTLNLGIPAGMEGYVQNLTAKMTSSALYIPGSVNVSLAVSVDLHSVSILFAAIPELVCRVGGNEVISKNGDKVSGFSEKTITCNETWNGTLSAGTPDVQIENAYTMASAYVYVKSVNLLYR